MKKTKSNRLFKKFIEQFERASFYQQLNVLDNADIMNGFQTQETIEFFVKILDPDSQHINHSDDSYEIIRGRVFSKLHSLIERDEALITPALVSRVFYYRNKEGDSSPAGILLHEMTNRRPELAVYQNNNFELAAAADVCIQQNLKKRTLAFHEQSIKKSFRIVADLALRPIAGDQNLYLTFERRAGDNLGITLDLTKMSFLYDSRGRKGLNRLKRRLEQIPTVQNIILTEQYADRQNYRKTQPIYYDSYIQGTTSALSTPKLTATLPCTQETLIALREAAKAMLQHEISLTLVAGVRAARKLAREYNGVELYEKTCQRMANKAVRPVNQQEQTP